MLFHSIQTLRVLLTKSLITKCLTSNKFLTMMEIAMIEIIHPILSSKMWLPYLIVIQDRMYLILILCLIKIVKFVINILQMILIQVFNLTIRTQQPANLWHDQCLQSPRSISLSMLSPSKDRIICITRKLWWTWQDRIKLSILSINGDKNNC